MRRPEQSKYNFEDLINDNNQFVESFKSNPLVLLIENVQMNQAGKRKKLLACVQVFSNYFQRIVMLRRILTDKEPYFSVAHQHLCEEFGHDIALNNDRKNQPVIWDAALEGGASWFLWKMFNSNDAERTLLVHFVLEASADIFFTKAHAVMSAKEETNYFGIHSEVDSHHVDMARNVLSSLSEFECRELSLLQKHGWDMINMVCKRIAEIVVIDH